MVSELERAKNIPDEKTKNEVIENQINKAKSLADVITVLLEISKNESGNEISLETIRLDELIFNGIEELSITNPEFRFEISFKPDNIHENQLELKANTLLINQAFLNVMRNCIFYSLNPQAKIIFDGTAANQISISFINEGNPIAPEEEKYLFDHFYKGSNNPRLTGFGLGLVLTKKIVELHHGSITYSNPSGNKIQFDISFPLS
nr:HAMP domain-containing sensor histidine kinase [Aequorivita capsosiphonis]